MLHLTNQMICSMEQRNKIKRRDNVEQYTGVYQCKLTFKKYTFTVFSKWIHFVQETQK